MDASDGAELCVVCGDAATGFHYRCMTCEGCKGFFRRTIQKDLRYFCKAAQQCVVDKSTRNQCQQCRFTKCIEAGMATDLVLGDTQRVAKRQLIEENRERRKLETIRSQLKCGDDDGSAIDDRWFIQKVAQAYCNNLELERRQDAFETDAAADSWQEQMSPYLAKAVMFARDMPGFDELASADKTALLKSSWMQLLVLTVAALYDEQAGVFELGDGSTVGGDTADGLGALLLPLVPLAQSLARLQLDNAEMALLAALLVANPESSAVQDAATVAQLQERLLAVLRRHVLSHASLLRFSKLIFALSDVRDVAARQLPRFSRVDCATPGAIIKGAVSVHKSARAALSRVDGVEGRRTEEDGRVGDAGRLGALRRAVLARRDGCERRPLPQLHGRLGAEAEGEIAVAAARVARRRLAQRIHAQLIFQRHLAVAPPVQRLEAAPRPERVQPRIQADLQARAARSQRPSSEFAKPSPRCGVTELKCCWAQSTKYCKSLLTRSWSAFSTTGRSSAYGLIVACSAERFFSENVLTVLSSVEGCLARTSSSSSSSRNDSYDDASSRTTSKSKQQAHLELSKCYRIQVVAAEQKVFRKLQFVRLDCLCDEFVEVQTIVSGGHDWHEIGSSRFHQRRKPGPIIHPQ